MVPMTTAFSILPAGYYFANNTNPNPSVNYYGRGQYAVFLTSTAYATNRTPIMRLFHYDRGAVMRLYHTNVAGLNSAFSVRCVRSLQPIFKLYSIFKSTIP